MPYGNDDWVVESERRYRVSKERVSSEHDERLKARLRDELNVPNEFLDLAVEVWWAGKED
jgi:hypothetical protein